MKRKQQGKPSSVEEILFSTLEQVADAITKTFPRNCEAVVHDLSDPQQSVRYIAGNVTRRKIGAPVTDLVVRALHQEGRDIADRFSYKTMTKDGRELKSSTVFFRDLKGQVIGAFCINFDTTDYLNATHALEVFTATSGDFEGNDKVETFASSFTETVEALFQQAVSRIGKQSSSMSTEEKIRLVQELARNGVFQIKGAVDEVSLLMGISKYTVYSYLKKLRALNHIGRT
jgi:predicted transcriptional regulator YheO